jgi:adenylyltransferase/sulfurtransferase
VLQYLCAAGVGTLGIVDNDWVTLSNLPRQILYSAPDIGKPKPFAAKEKLSQINIEPSVITYFDRLRKDNVFEIFKEYQIIVDCSDNFATRYLISDAAVILNKPVVYGAANKFTGQITVLNYKNGPTLRCICPTPPHPLEVLSCSETGVFSTVTGIIGAMQATEVIKLILEMKSVLTGKFLEFDAINYSTQIFTFEIDPIASAIQELTNYDDACIDPDENIRVINLNNLYRLQEENPGLQIIDIREQPSSSKLALDHILIPYYDINENINQISAYSVVVFYCTYGILSAQVISYLQNKYKFTNLYSLIC